MKKDFEERRAILLDAPDPRPFNVKGYDYLAQCLTQREIHPDSQVLVAHIGHQVLVLPMLDMVYHHIAQGSLEGIHWMAAYCCLCNGGSAFIATHARKRYTFAVQGYYDMMILMADQETGSYWNHLTGTCLFGPMAGVALPRLGALVQMRAQDALAAYPDAQIAISDGMSKEEARTALNWDKHYRQPAQPQMSDDLLATGNLIDSRLPRYDMGLGLWTSQTQRYYPIMRLYESQNVIVDHVDGRGVVIVLNEQVGLPFAFYCEATSVEVQDNCILLGTGMFYQNHMLCVNGRRTRPEVPNHVAIRWYAFSSVFPNCQIYAHEDYTHS